VHAGDIHREPPTAAMSETVGDLFDTIVSKPATIPDHATLRDAVDAILDSGLTRKAYVVDAGEHLKGTITMESDAATDLMAKPVPVTRATPIGEIVRRVVEEHLNDFPVVDEAGRLIGEVNTHSLLKATRGVFSTSDGDASHGP